MTFIGATGSDTGIINVNGSTSGAGESLEKWAALMGFCADLIRWPIPQRSARRLVATSRPVGVASREVTREFMFRRGSSFDRHKADTPHMTTRQLEGLLPLVVLHAQLFRRARPRAGCHLRLSAVEILLKAILQSMPMYRNEVEAPFSGGKDARGFDPDWTVPIPEREASWSTSSVTD
jgi:hypothetical protein